MYRYKKCLISNPHVVLNKPLPFSKKWESVNYDNGQIYTVVLATFYLFSFKIEELSILLDKCTDRNIVLALACCNAITDMVQLGITDYEFTMRSLLNMVPSAK